MKSSTSTRPKGMQKVATGILGFDEITGGGLPQGRTTLVGGGPGSGKTLFALQFLVHGATACKESGIFVGFEETAQRIAANVESFGWNLAGLRRKSLFFLDAQPTTGIIHAGDFDLGGMLAALQVQTATMSAKRIVFDALDIAMALLPDPATRRREIYRLHEWLLAHKMTAIITSKASANALNTLEEQPFGFMQFMVDCSVILNHTVTLGVSQRNLRIQKYRGSSFDENECPFVIGGDGFDVASSHRFGRLDRKVTNERVTSGVERLDTMLGGGYYRCASILVTGFPGTAKTTLSGAFAEAACERGERTLFVGFDSDGSEIVRNLASVGMRLDRHIKSGLLHIISARTITGSAETLLARIKALALEHKARCLVIDPVSTLAKAGNELTAHSVAERLIDWTKTEGVTLLCTSLVDDTSGSSASGALLHISTLSDIWIHLDYVVQAGERNRSLSIIKSRGSSHSNQVRELILSDDGVTLADIYTAGGEVLMGTLRWEKERTVRHNKEMTEAAEKLKRVKLDAEEAELEVRLKSLQTELVAKLAEKTLLSRTMEGREQALSHSRSELEELRGGDEPANAKKADKP